MNEDSIERGSTVEMISRTNVCERTTAGHLGGSHHRRRRNCHICDQRAGAPGSGAAQQVLNGIAEIKSHLANIITGFRVVLIPFIYVSLTSARLQLCLSLYLMALFSDVLDGVVARRTGSSSLRGAFFDACVDFLLAFSGSLGCAVLGLIDFWVLGVLVLVFLQFVVGFGRRRPVYDPIGKIFGLFSLLIVPLMLIFPSISSVHVESSIQFLGGLSILGKRVQQTETHNTWLRLDRGSMKARR
jgi:phosphatidylglycerophosphate synthase